MIAFSPKSNRARLKRGQSITLEDLDVRLDVTVAEFDRTVTRLVKDVRAKGVSLDIPAGESLIALKPIDSRVSWTRLYEAQVQRLARMDRSEEFRVARRYEFAKAWVKTALQENGLPEETFDEILRGRSELPALDQKKPAVANLHRAVTGFERIRNDYIEGSLYMVLSCAYRYRNLGVDFADLIQEGNASLFQAVEGFDWRRDVRFKTYAQYWIHQAILKALYNASRTVRLPIWVQKALTKIHRVREQGRKQTGEAPTNLEVGQQLDMPESKVKDLLASQRRAVSLDAEVTGEDGASLADLLPDGRTESVLDTVDDGNLGECLDEVMEDLPSRERMILDRRFGLHGRVPETLGQIAADLGITAERVRQLQNAALTRLKKPIKMGRLRAYT